MLSRIKLPFVLCSLAIVSGIPMGTVRADTPASTSKSEHSAADRALLARLPQAWEASAPLIGPEPRGVARSHAQKDPTVVFHDGRWHVFMTVKLADRTAIEYCNFADWKDAQSSPRTLLPLSESEYFGAPQVFFFRPQQRWYLVYQVGRPQPDKMWVAYSTTANLADANSWTKAQPMLDGGPNDPRVEGGLDHLQFLFQGMLEVEKKNLAYGQYRWRIGLLTPLPSKP